VASASARQVTCDDCKTAIAGLEAHLTGEESLAEQIAILIAAGCPTAADPAMCEMAVAKYWPGIAKALYGFFFSQKEPCGEMGMNVCKSTTPKEWTCQECADAITLLSGIMTQQTYVDEAIVYLQGPAYCGDGGEHMENCEEAIGANIGNALAILGQAIIAQTESLCQDVIGVC